MPILTNPYNNFKALNLTLKFYFQGFFLLFFYFWLSKQQKGIIKLPSIAVTKIISLATIHH